MLSTCIALSNVSGFLIYFVKIPRYISNKQILHICDNATERKSVANIKIISAIVFYIKNILYIGFYPPQKNIL